MRWRIGRNEMEALEVCRALVDAEKEYYANAHAYTAKFISTSDEHDGLYWKSMNDVARSPIGPYLAHAGVESDGGSAELSWVLLSNFAASFGRLRDRGISGDVLFVGRDDVHYELGRDCLRKRSGRADSNGRETDQFGSFQ
jgi:hypothetical protein